MNSQEYLILFEDCKVVDGYSQSIIYDLTRPSNSNIIPTSLSTILKEFKENTIQTILNKYPEESEIIIEYIEFLIDNEFAIIGDEHLKNQLSPLDQMVNSPEKIENSIIQLTDDNASLAFEFIQKVRDKLCSRLEIRIQDLKLKHFERLCHLIQDSTFNTVIIRSKYISDIENRTIESIIENEERILEHHVYKSPSNRMNNKTKYIVEDVDFTNDCGNINQENFSINRESFFANKCFNSCLYKKVSINFEGKVCNCPSLKDSNYQDDLSNFENFISGQEYTSLTQINKDEIEVCKDCEYRYMCLDCRAFRDNESDLFSRPSKCTYNPYQGLWEGDEGYIDVVDWHH